MTATLDARAHGRQGTAAGRQAIARWEVIAVAGAMSVVAVIGVIAISRGAPLLWDEAVYSLRVRDLVGEGVRGHYWIEVRAPGLPALLSPVGLLPGGADLLSGGDAVALRGMCLLLPIAGVGLTWLIARSLIGPRGAALAAWLLAIAPGWHESSWQVMPDIPGAVLTLAAMVVVLYAARGSKVSWWALLAAPLCAAATLVRYGAPLLIGPAVLAALLLRWEAVRSSRLRSSLVLASTAAAAGLVWFVPAVTGSSRPPVLIFAGRQDDKAIPALTSAADFLTRLGQMVGPVFGLVVVVGGAIALVVAARRPALRSPVIACALIALSVLLLMLFGIAQYNVRYLAPSLPFLAILASVGVLDLADRTTSRTVVVALAAAVGVVGVGFAANAAVDRTNELMQRFGPVRTAYDAIARTAEGPCVVLDKNPAAEWYTGCAAFGADQLRRLAGTPQGPGVGPDEPLSAVIQDYPNRGNPSRQWQTFIEELAVGAVHTSQTITVLELGSVGRFTTELERRGVLEQR